MILIIIQLTIWLSLFSDSELTVIVGGNSGVTISEARIVLVNSYVWAVSEMDLDERVWTDC